MAIRSLLLTGIALACFVAGCVSRQPPWKLVGRSPCADLEERVDRDRQRADSLAKNTSRQDEVAWYRDDMREATRLLNDCKARVARAEGPSAIGSADSVRLGDPQ